MDTVDKASLAIIGMVVFIIIAIPIIAIIDISTRPNEVTQIREIIREDRKPTYIIQVCPKCDRRTVFYPERNNE